MNVTPETNSSQNKTNDDSGKERMATTATRSLAIIGLAVVIALLTWVVIRGVHQAPVLTERMQAMVSSLTNLLRTPEDSIAINLASHTLASNATTTIHLAHTGKNAPEAYQFSFGCVETVSAEILINDSWMSERCATPRTITEPEVVVRFTLTEGRFADIELRIESGAFKDATVVTVTNTSTPLTITSNGTDDTDQTTGTTYSPTTGTTPQPVLIPRPTPSPADLALNIETTGITLEVDGNNTFFPLSVVPVDGVAAVRFTVTNIGNTPSGIWAFRAWLPTQNNEIYPYTSPVQNSLEPHMQIEFTLGFDQILDADTGTITIELVPTDPDDQPLNNVDAVQLHIDTDA